MSFVLAIVIIGGFVAFGLSFAVGANDAANALGTSVGSKALTLMQAVILGGIMEFLGVVTMGAFVSNTLKSKVLNPDEFDDQVVFIMGMFAAMVSSTLLLLCATFLGLPVSTTQTIVGGIVGFGLVTHGGGLKSSTLTQIAVSWVATPILGLALGYVLYWMVERTILRHDDPVSRSQKLAPVITALTIGVLGGFITSSQRKIWKFHFMWIPISFGVSFVLGLSAAYVLRRYAPSLNLDMGTPKYARSRPTSPLAADPEAEFDAPSTHINIELGTMDTK